MSESSKCPECGAALPPGAEEAPCPGCLMKLGLESWTHRRRGAEGGATAAPTTPLSERFVPPEPQELAKLFPQLEIIELIGKGGMGAVYKACQKGLDRLVAVKILPTEIGRDPAFAERFAREARALARLNHPNIVSVFDYGQANGLYYFVMEYVDGANLRQLVRDQHPEPQQALALVSQICDALQFAHDEGIVHRDIKPENILVDRRGRAKIADFGLAKLLGMAPAETALTQDRQAMGTLHYMAPEQMQGSRGVDHRADLYSLGVVFYELLTGELPLGRFTLPSTKLHVDVRLDDIVLRSLEREPERRYQRASEIKTDIQSVSDTSLAAAAPALEPPQPEADDRTGVIDPRLQVPSILLILAGVLNLLPVPLAMLMAMAAFFGRGIGGLGPIELLLTTIAVPIGALQIVSGVLLRKQHGWGLGMVAGAVSILPCGVGWLISAIASVWTLVVLSDPSVKATFEAGGTGSASPDSRLSAIPAGPPQFSRKAIIGAFWAPLFLLLVLAVVPSVTLTANRSGDASTHATPSMLFILFGLLAMVLGGSSVFGTTILGLLAIRDIRGSGGRIRGLRLAVLDSMLFPLLLLDCLITAAVFALIRLAEPAAIPVAAILLFFILPLCLFVDVLLVWLVWRNARMPAVAPAGAEWALPGQAAPPAKAAEEIDAWPEPAHNGPSAKIAGAVLLAILLIGAALTVARWRGFPESTASRLMEAVRQSDIPTADSLLAAHPHLLETRDDELLTPLNLASFRGDTALVRRLLENGADVDTFDVYGETPLIKAAAMGHVAVVTALLERGPEVNHRDKDGDSALMLAAGRGHLPIVAKLLDDGAGIDIQDNQGRTALLMAAAAGREKIVQLLLERNADIDATGEIGTTPLIEAAAGGHLSIVKALLDHGADVNRTTAFSDTALTWAVQRGRDSTVDYLLAHGADVTQRDADGRGILHYAADDKIYQRLRDAGAPVGPPELFREGYKLAVAGKFAEAATALEQARKSDSSPPREIEAKLHGWLYRVPRPDLTLRILQADCYARGGEPDKARELLTADELPWPDARSATLYQRQQDSPGRQVTERYELSRAEFDRFLQSPDQPLSLRLHRRDVTELRQSGGVHSTSSEGESPVKGAFHY